MKRLIVALVSVLFPVSALADDEQAPVAPPSIPRGGWTPPAVPPAAVDPDQLAVLVDRAVERAFDRRLGVQSPPAASPAVPALPSPQAAAGRPGYVRVIVPAPLHRRAIAAVGERMARCAAPTTRMMRLAPEACAARVRPSGQSSH